MYFQRSSGWIGQSRGLGSSESEGEEDTRITDVLLGVTVISVGSADSRSFVSHAEALEGGMHSCESRS